MNKRMTSYARFWTMLVTTFAETQRHPELWLNKAKVDLKFNHYFNPLAPFPVEAGST